MKAIKIILSIITILVMAFLVTGLVVKETTYKTQVVVKKPITEVFKLINSVDSTQNWITDIKSIEVVKQNPNVVGSTYKMTVNNRGDEVVMTQKVLAYVPNEKVTYYYEADNMVKTDSYTFLAVDNKTTITKTSACRSNSYIMACIFPYFKETLREIDQQYLDSFKLYSEKK